MADRQASTERSSQNDDAGFLYWNAIAKLAYGRYLDRLSNGKADNNWDHISDLARHAWIVFAQETAKILE